MIKNLLKAYPFSGIKTCLNEFHLAHSGKMVEFAGYQLPVQYKTGVMKQHLHCRNSSSLFDVSHMGQIQLKGKDSLKLLERVTVGNTNRRIKQNIVQCYLTMFLNDQAGIIDDAIAAIVSPENIRFVVNGANKHTVLKHLQKVKQQQNYNTNIIMHSEKGLIALQGPKSVNILQTLFSTIKFENMPFMSQISGKWDGKEYLLSRSGYTGEDGFQISGLPEQIVSITKRLVEFQQVELAGLGARDSLRLQAGLCLHGNDISPKTTPLEANLMWTVHKRGENDSRIKFIGQDYLKKQGDQVKAKKITIKKRVGFMVDGPGIIRQHCKIFENGKQIGQSTSGTFGPCLKIGVGMAYIEQHATKQGTKLQAELRGKLLPIIIKKMPFVASKYYKGWGTFP